MSRGRTIIVALVTLGCVLAPIAPAAASGTTGPPQTAQPGESTGLGVQTTGNAPPHGVLASHHTSTDNASATNETNGTDSDGAPAAVSSELSDSPEPILPPARLNPFAVVWNRTFRGDNAALDWLFDVESTADGGVVAVGMATQPSGRVAWLIKFDASGVVEFQRFYDGGARAKGVVQTADGGFALVGYTRSSGSGGLDAWLIRTDAAGAVQYNQTYGGSGDDEMWGVVPRPGGGFVLAGVTESFGSGRDDGWVLRINDSGGLTGDRVLGGGGDNDLSAITRTNDGNMTVAGNLASDSGWVVELSEANLTVPTDCSVDLTGDGTPATDPDGDGQCEDIDGDGGFDILDVAALLDMT